MATKTREAAPAPAPGSPPLVTFHNVTITVAAATPLEALEKVQRMLNDAAAWTTDTYNTNYEHSDQGFWPDGPPCNTDSLAAGRVLQGFNQNHLFTRYVREGTPK